ncbi:MAG: hypothetical protein V4530_06980 [Pseudomonadota bacterium]
MKNAFLLGKYTLGKNPRKWGLSPNEKMRRSRLAVGGCVVIAILLWIDAWSSTTKLLTWPNMALLWTMQIAGLTSGLVLGIRIVSTGSRFKNGITASLLGLLGFITGDYLAWRLADRYEFALSGAPYRQSAYQIINVDHGRARTSNGPRIEISPYGKAIGIAVSEDQIRVLDRERWQDGHLCVRVWDRPARDGAIELAAWGPHSPMLRMPEIEIVSCADA